MTGAAPLSPAPNARRARAKVVVAIAVAAGIALFALANFHLVYVAVTSQPECVPHAKPGDAAPINGALNAARSSC